MFEIKFTGGAIKDLRWFNNSELKVILAGIEFQLGSEPTTETRHRKQLDAKDLAPWELRIGRVRVFYGVDEKNELIEIEAIGCRRNGHFADSQPKVRARKHSVSAESVDFRRGNVIVRSEEEDDVIPARADDFDREVELTRENKELMAFLEKRSKQKATVSLEKARKRLDIED